MKIIFISDNIYYEHLGIMSLSSILKNAGHDVEISEAKYNSIKTKLSSSGFTVLAYSAHSFIAPYFLELNRKIKEEFNVFSVFGGPHLTYYPEIINEPCVDGVCIGEGEYALLDLVNNLAEGRPIKNIENWRIRQDGRIFQNPVRPLINDLDTLPFADRKLFPVFYVAFILTARGCPYKCSFCQPWTPFRRRSVDNVMEELRQLKSNANARFVYFVDMTFNISDHWLNDFSEKYRSQIGLPFHCRIRADLVTPENTKCLKDAGCFSMGMGIETANDYLRNKVLNKAVSRDEIISAAKIIKQNKIRLLTFNITGIPLGSLEDDLETLRLNIKCRPDYVKVEPLFIYKGTDIYNFVTCDKRFEHLEAPQQDNYYIFWKSKNYIYPALRRIPLFKTGSGFYNTRRMINLNQLFSLVVEFPFFLPLVPLLIKLPLRRVYGFLYLVWGRYCLYFRIWGGGRMLGWNKFIIWLIKGIKQFKLGAQLIQQIDD